MHLSGWAKQYTLKSSLTYMENVVFVLVILIIKHRSICHYKYIFLIVRVG